MGTTMHTSPPPASGLKAAIEEQGYRDAIAGEPRGSHHLDYLAGYVRGSRERGSAEISGSTHQIFISPSWSCIHCGGRGGKPNREPDGHDRDSLCPCVTRQLPRERHLQAEVVLTDRNEMPWSRGRSLEGA